MRLPTAVGYRQIICLWNIHVLTHFVIESALAIKELKELHISLTSPEVEVSDLEITPDYPKKVSLAADRPNIRERSTYSGRGCMSYLRHRK